ncbi:MAG: DUF2809 domain-containing protein [Defluviitaleaceae bacterium]|nr:DUF2809 domain-containing protein [Defluviitaleaceae bacterium]
MKIKFSLRYLIATIVLLLAIVAIALWMPSGFIRYHFGDVLIVVFIYSFVRIFVRNRWRWLPFGIFAFAAAVEVGQYFGLVYMLGLGDSQFWRVVIGTTFDWWDLVMYAIGCGLIFAFNTLIGRGGHCPSQSD